MTSLRLPYSFRRICVLLAGLGPLVAGLGSPSGWAMAQPVGLYDVWETQVTNTNTYTNPFDSNEIELQATFTSPSGGQVSFFGFYDGDGTGGQTGSVWKLRFMPDEIGTWSYTYTWTDATPGGSGNFSVTDTGLPGPVKVDPNNSWYFEDARGNPFHFRGYDTHNFIIPWAATTKLTTELQNYKDEIQAMVDNGYNFTMLDAMSDRVRGWTGESWWFDTSDTKTFDIAVWVAWEDLISFMKDRDVYAIPFDGFVAQGSQYGFTDMKVFLRYHVARLGAYYNYFGWSPTWEWTDIWTSTELDQIMQYAYDIDPWKRLLTAHDCSHSSFTGWLGFSMRQAHSNNVLAGNSRTAGQSQGSCGQPGGVAPAFVNQPIIGSEDIWESTFSTMPTNKTEVRRAAWGLQMAGVMPLYSEWANDPPPTGGNGEGEPEVRRMFDFFYTKTRYRQYQQLNGLVSGSAVASGIPGEEYLVYDENGGSITIDLSAAPASTSFSVLWYDPQTGAEQTGANINGGASRTLNSPFSGDSVLHLGSNVLPPPDTTPPTVSITSPTAGSTVSDTVSVSASASDDVGISSVEFRVDGSTITTDTIAPYTISWNTTTITNGSHSLSAVATDTSGNTTTSSPVSVTVSNVTPPSGSPLISNLTAASGEVYEVVENGLQNGVLAYIDRTFTYSGVPTWLQGVTYIKTANGDKASQGDQFLSFELNQPATVYVAHDDRYQIKPDWLLEFQDTGENLTTDVPFSIFQKVFPAGTVILGGNVDPAEAEGNSMYTVIIVGPPAAPRNLRVSGP